VICVDTNLDPLESIAEPKAPLATRSLGQPQLRLISS
jgi:hypothetical protein